MGNSSVLDQSKNKATNIINSFSSFFGQKKREQVPVEQPPMNVEQRHQHPPSQAQAPSILPHSERKIEAHPPVITPEQVQKRLNQEGLLNESREAKPLSEGDNSLISSGGSSGYSSRRTSVMEDPLHFESIEDMVKFLFKIGAALCMNNKM